MHPKVPVKIKIINPKASQYIPKYQTDLASGFDIHALETVYLHAGMLTQSTLIPTGLAFQVPPGYELQIRPRSGLSLKTRLRISNSPGTLDADFVGELCIIAENQDPNHSTLTVNAGDRIAQGVIVPVVQAEFEIVEELDDTSRGAGGFGSTGK